MTTDAKPPEAWASLALSTPCAVVGLGGAGSEAVQDLVSLGMPGVRAFAINSDAKHLLRMGVEERILIGARELRGRGSGGDPRRSARKSARKRDPGERGGRGNGQAEPGAGQPGQDGNGTADVADGVHGGLLRFAARSVTRHGARPAMRLSVTGLTVRLSAC